MTTTDLECIHQWLQAADADVVDGVGSPWPHRYARDVRLLLEELAEVRSQLCFSDGRKCRIDDAVKAYSDSASPDA